MASDDGQAFSDIEQALKKAAAALREADIPFLLGGSLASWARGGPETRHDLDLMIKPEDVDAAVKALEAAGLRPEEPPEEGLPPARARAGGGWGAAGPAPATCRSVARAAGGARR